MDPPDDVPSSLNATESSNDGSQPWQNPKEHHRLETADIMATDVMRMENQMSNQCFEMAVKVHAEKNFSELSELTELEAERYLPDVVRELEEAKVETSLNTANHRLQKIFAESLSEDDPYRQRLIALLDNILSVQKESRELEERIIQIQKEKLELKRRTLEKLKESDDLRRVLVPKEQELCLQKAMTNLEKYNKMIAVTQRVLQGILIACKVNWMDDPNIRDLLLNPPLPGPPY